MRFHVVSLPHTQTTQAFSACAYTVKVINFCRMMKARGHTVFLYAGEANEAPCDELIPCLSEADRLILCNGGHYSSVPFDSNHPQWKRFNETAAAEVRKRLEPKDFLCIIGGYAQKDVSDGVPELTTVEFGVGYGGIYSNFRVFESYAWMHTVYGSQHPHNPHAVDGRWYDTVIPGYLDPAMFPFEEKKDDYFLFVGRLIDRKGPHIAAHMARELGVKLVVAGHGNPPPDCEYVGVVGPEERGCLMSRAKALIAPTIYIEPFGNVAIEAQACGTPVISTDWGAFTETVKHGETGFRCRTMAEFVHAGRKVSELNPHAIRQHVLDRYSLDVVGEMYEDYFTRLMGLHHGGWYATNPWNDNVKPAGITYAGLTLAANQEAVHLGGNIVEGDAYTHSPSVWSYVIDRFAVKSVMDLGSGRGHAAQFFANKGLSVVAVDGLETNVQEAHYPTICHDLTKGPFKTKVDLVHCQEVVEHIDEAHLDHLLNSFRSGDVVLLTHAVPGQGGYHHVNCKGSDYWIEQMRLAGYAFLPEDTQRIRKLAEADRAIYMAKTGLLFHKIEKTYPQIKIGAHYNCFKRRKAVEATLKAFRKHYPEAPVCLFSDNGEDFTDLAETFNCEYEWDSYQTGNGRSTYFETVPQAREWLKRLYETCRMFREVDWIVLLEDDVLTQDRISRLPKTPIAGPCTMPYTPELIASIQAKYPNMTIPGYSGCGGTILNRAAYLRAFETMPLIEDTARLDDRIAHHSDALLTWVMMAAGFENSLWDDHSERSRRVGRLDAAFDHQNKSHYDEAA